MRSRPSTRRRSAGVTAALAAALAALAGPPRAEAAGPSRLQLEGALLAAAGPAADGDYALTLRWYAGAAAPKAALEQKLAAVSVVGGRFAALIALDAAAQAALAVLADPWLGVQVGAEPELARRAVAAAPYALHAATAAALACTGCVGADAIANGAIASAKVGFPYAASAAKGGAALDLACTGCVSVEELAFDGDVDLGGNGLKAGAASFAGDVVAKTVTATAFVGDGSKLTGIATPKGACAAGEAVTGVAADGKLVCGALGAALPANGLSQVSNGLLSAQFEEQVASSGAVAIPDNTGSAATSILTIPSWGSAEALTITAKVVNTDLSKVAIRLLPPDDKKDGYLLCDPCGAADAKLLEGTWTSAKPLAKGDLAAWLGKDPAGTWNLVVTDTAYCIKQAPGNADLCDPTGKTDGALESWSVQVKTLSSKKVQAKAALLFHVSDKEPIACEPTVFGASYANPKDKALYVCNGKEWAAVYLTVPGSKENPVKSCKELQAKVPDVKSGLTWIANGGDPVQLYCDMTTDGGGWTVIADESATACGAAWSGWSDSKGTDASVNGACTRVHGVWGAGGKTAKTFSAYGVGHSQVRVYGRYYAIDSWDSESQGAQLWVDGALRWSATKAYGGGGGGGWTTASVSPAPWGGSSVDGYWTLEAVLGALSHSAATVGLEFRTGLDQDLSDESFAVSHVRVLIR